MTRFPRRAATRNGWPAPGRDRGGWSLPASWRLRIATSIIAVLVGFLNIFWSPFSDISGADLYLSMAIDCVFLPVGFVPFLACLVLFEHAFLSFAEAQRLPVPVAYTLSILLAWQAGCLGMLVVSTIVHPFAGQGDDLLSSLGTMEQLTFSYAVSGYVVVLLAYFVVAPWLRRRKQRR